MVEDSAIRIQRLRVVRSRRVVLPDLSLDIPSGRVTGLLGPSGCGKSTLMRAIVGVQRIESGEVQVLGQPAGSSALRSRIGYVTQAPAVYEDLTVRENLEYFASVLGVPKEHVSSTLVDVGLEDAADAPVSQLSGGQRARTSLATALVNRPDVLVLDEPTVGLDPVLRRQIWDTFADLASDGVTLLVSSHVMDEAERCDALVLMREGEVLAQGEPGELLARTNSESMEDAFLALVGEKRNS